MRTIRQFCQRNHITIAEAKEIGVRVDDGWEHTAWTVVLAIQPLDQYRRTMIVPWKQGMAHHEAPTVEHVVNAIGSDAASYDNARDFADFCAEFGYSDDSIKARDTYQACGDTVKNLTTFLGSSRLVEQLIYETGGL